MVLFVLAGLFLAGSIFSFDTCTACPYYFNDGIDNFNQLTFSSDRVGNIFENCFYENQTSIFSAFTDTTILTQFG